MPKSILTHEEVGHTDEATKELREHLPSVKITPKPTRLIRHLMKVAGIKKGDVFLDCFAGTGTSGQAVFEMEKEGEDSPDFILIQFPENIGGQNSSLSKVMKERLTSSNSKSGGSGFKAFKLNASNFRVWNGNGAEFDEAGEQLDLHVEHLADDAEPTDILWEILLKAGFKPTIEIKEVSMAGKTVFCIADGALLICLEKEVTEELIDALAEADPIQVICLDEAFKGNDQLKANAVQTFASRAAAQESEIVFRTV